MPLPLFRSSTGPRPASLPPCSRVAGSGCPDPGCRTCQDLPESYPATRQTRQTRRLLSAYPRLPRAGTSFDLNVPNRSTKLIRKYLMPFCFATCARSVVMSVSSRLTSMPQFKYVRIKICCLRGSSQCPQAALWPWRQLRLSAPPGLQVPCYARGSCRRRAPGSGFPMSIPADNWRSRLPPFTGSNFSARRITLRGNARRVLAILVVIIITRGSTQFAVFLFIFRAVVTQGYQGCNPYRNRICAQGQCLGHVRAAAYTPGYESTVLSGAYPFLSGLPRPVLLPAGWVCLRAR